MLHAVWDWHLYYLETCFISLFQTKSAANWFKHLGDFCEHMFPLSSYFSSKNAQGHLTACKLGVFWGERSIESFIACDVIVISGPFPSNSRSSPFYQPGFF